MDPDLLEKLLEYIDERIDEKIQDSMAFIDPDRFSGSSSSRPWDLRDELRELCKQTLDTEGLD